MRRFGRSRQRGRVSTHLWRVLIEQRRKFGGALATRVEPREEVQAASQRSASEARRTSQTEPCADRETASQDTARPSYAAASTWAGVSAAPNTDGDARCPTQLRLRRRVAELAHDDARVAWWAACGRRRLHPARLIQQPKGRQQDEAGDRQEGAEQGRAQAATARRVQPRHPRQPCAPNTTLADGAVPSKRRRRHRTSNRRDATWSVRVGRAR